MATARQAPRRSTSSRNGSRCTSTSVGSCSARKSTRRMSRPRRREDTKKSHENAKARKRATKTRKHENTKTRKHEKEPRKHENTQKKNHKDTKARRRFNNDED